MTFKKDGRELLESEQWSREGRDLTREFYIGVNEIWKVHLLREDEVKIPDKYNIIYAKFLRKDFNNVKNLWDLAVQIGQVFEDFNLEVLDRGVLESWKFDNEEETSYLVIDNFLKQYFSSLRFLVLDKKIYFPRYEDILKDYDKNKLPIFWDKNNQAFFEEIGQQRYRLMENYNDKFSSWTIKKDEFNKVMLGVDKTMFLTANMINIFRSENLQLFTDEVSVYNAMKFKVLRSKLVLLEKYFQEIDFVGDSTNMKKFKVFLSEIKKPALTLVDVDIDKSNQYEYAFDAKVNSNKIITENFNKIYNSFCKNFGISVGGITLAVQGEVQGALSPVNDKGGLSEYKGE